MKFFNNYIGIGIIVIFFNLNCGKNEDIKKDNIIGDKSKRVENCYSSKIQLLLDNVFRKKYLYPIMNRFVANDSSFSYNYLSAKEFTIPAKVNYLHYSPVLDPTKSDSVKLILLDDTLSKGKDANRVYIRLKETNKDTTNIQLLVDYTSLDNVALTVATFRYSFDTNNCRWTVKDSTFWQY